MSQTWETVRVFISSTFRDMQSERDWLVRFVFPKLRQELLQRRIHLVDVDLRWGVTSEQDAFSVCREVVDECRPRFLCMLGGRYGWVPPGKTRSITADEVHYGVLDRDLKSRGFAYFYFRDPSATAAMVEVTPGEFREPAGSHGADALAELKAAITGAGLQPFIYQAQWDDQSRRLIGLKEFGDRVYADLKQSIDQEFGPKTGEKPDEFTEENAAKEAFIEERIQRFVLGSRQTVLSELLAHANSTGGNGYVCLTGVPGSGKSALLAKFCQLSTLNLQPSTILITHFVGASPGSTDVRRTLRRLCHELVTGAGLTAEIPEDPEKLRVAFAEILQQATAQKRVVILLDAINQFDPTTQLAGWSWLPEELPATARIILSTLVEPRNTRSTRKEAAEETGGQRAEVGDQKSEGRGQRAVISDQLSVVGPVLESLRHRRNPPREIELQPLTAEDAEAIIREFLHRYRKSMTDDQRAALLAKADAGTPLYLLVALEELRTLGTYEEITDRIAQLPADTRALFIWILKRLEDDDGFRDASGLKIGQDLVARFVSLLGASRHGLSQQELVELLSPGDPQGNVAAIAQLLRPYLMQRGELLDFYHGQFRKAAATSYLPSETQSLAAHRQLATYFRNKADPERNQSWKGDRPRPFLEVVFHLVRAQRTDDYCQTLCDPRFVEARCRLGHVVELNRDYQWAQENLAIACDCIRPEQVAKLKDWHNFLANSTHKFLRHVEPFRQIMWNYAGDGVVSKAVGTRGSHLKEPWIRLLNRPLLSEHTCLRVFQGHTGGVMAVALTADGQRAVSASLDTTLRLWDLRNGQCLQTYHGHTKEVNSVAVTSDGRHVISGSEDKTLRLWNLETGDCVWTRRANRMRVKAVAVTQDGRLAVSGGGLLLFDNSLRIWDLRSGTCLRAMRGHKLPINCVVLTRDGRQAISGSQDGTLRVWDLDTGRCLWVLECYPALLGGVQVVALTTSGDLAFSGGEDHYVKIWDIRTGVCVQAIRVGLGECRVRGLALSPDGRRLYIGEHIYLKEFDLATGSHIQTREGHTGDICAMAITPDGRFAISGAEYSISGCIESTLRLWDLQTKPLETKHEGHTFRVNCVAASQDGLRAVSGSGDHTVRVWDLERGNCVAVLRGHSMDVSTVALTPDRKRVISGDGDGSLRVWDADSGACLCVLDGHTNTVSSLAVTPDGQTAISGSRDKMLRIYDIESG